MDQAPPPPLVPPPVRPRLNWIVLIALLLAPAVLTCLAVLIDHRSNGPAPGVSLIAGALGGIAAGILLGRFVGRTAAGKVVLSLVFAAVCAVACIGMATVGCLATGYNLNLH